MPQRGKKYEDALKNFNREEVYPPVEAVKYVKAGAKAKFDKTVELSLRLGVDPRKADQIVRGTVTNAQVEEIAKTKMPDLNANDLEAAKKQVAGTARSMGISVV